MSPALTGASRLEAISAVEPLEPRRLLAVVEPSVINQADPHDAGLYLPPQYSLAAPEGFLSPPVRGKPLTVARQFLKSRVADLGLQPTDIAKTRVTDHYTDADTGITHIYLRQTFNGLDIANANLSIHLSRDNQVIMTGGGFVAGTGSSSFVAKQPRAIDRPAVTALKDAAARFGLQVRPETKVIRRASHTADRRQVLKAPQVSLDDVPARLHYVAGPDGLALAWDLVFRTPNQRNWINASVDAATGEVISSSDWISHASYNVYALPTEAPHDGPRTRVTNPHDPAVSPFGWHDTNGVAGEEFTTTNGNNAHAYLDRDSNNVPDVNGSPDGGAALIFDQPLDLTQAATHPDNQQAATTNLFYWNNVLHDVHARYGFTEAAGNFQVRNYGNQGIGGDAVNAELQDGGGINNARFGTPPDGSRPRMTMYLFDRTTPGRDSGLDSHLIAHEYGHGVSTRLTGGPANSNSLTAIQSDGMGEGWSDWWSLMFTLKPGDEQFDRYPFGTYVSGHDRVSGAGSRRFPYSYDMATNPLTFADYNSDSSKQIHRTGEIWCSALWDMTWLLINKHGFSPDISQGYALGDSGRNGGNNLALKLVMEGLKLQPANPSFIHARDAILAADTALTGGENHLQIWQAFARRGLGYSASTTASTSGLVTIANDLPPIAVAPGKPDLLPASDSGVSVTDDLTRLNNTSPTAALQFTVTGVTPGASVTLFADNVAIGSAVASDSSVIVSTDGSTAIADGIRSFVARQTFNDGRVSPQSAALDVTIDTTGPRLTQWQSAATHERGLGEVGLTITADDRFVEGRLGGITTLLLSINEMPNTATLSIGLWGTGSDNLPLDLSGTTWTAAYRTTGADPVLAITFSGGLPDYARYLIRVNGLTDLAGNAQVIDAGARRVITALLADASGDGRVNNTDLGGVFGLRGINPISRSQLYEVRSDLNRDGRINNSDAGGLMPLRGRDARFLTTPAEQ